MERHIVIFSYIITFTLIVFVILPDIFLRDIYYCVTQGATTCENNFAQTVFNVYDLIGWSIIFVFPAIIYLVSI